MNLKLIPQYELLQQEYIEDIHAQGYLLRHRKSGARVLVLQNDDNNKVFNIAFRTTPQDDTGVAHIMEHSVLCGSRLFPVKDPFVELVKGSLNTFLNAMTYPDKTMYPAASCNERDFCNLMHVYLDAVFYPNIYQKEEIFRQEGWHYELEDPEGEIIYNGVVYNEMKGAFSTPEDVLEREIMNTLFPDTTYGVESGGDPVHIPELTYEAFLDFHRKYYHPSNSYIYLYGDMDAEERLNWMDREYLSRFDQDEVDSRIRLQEPFERMREFEQVYPVTESDPVEDNTYLAWNAVIGTSLDVELCNAFAVLEYALVSAPGARLKQAVLDAGIGKDVMGSYDSGTLQPIFSLIVKNSNKEEKDHFLSVIRTTLQQIIEEGIDEKALLAGINTMEFKFREADYGSFPKGLIYGIDVFDSWLYDENRPFDYLKQLSVYDTLKEKVGSRYYEDLVRTYLLDNPHETLIVAVPERGLTDREDERVREKLAAYKASLTPAQVEQLVDRTKALRVFQDTPSPEEDLKKIPMLAREDIGKDVTPYANKELRWKGNTVLLHDVFTNGISYMNLMFESSDVGDEDIPYLGILKSVIGMVDTEHYSYSDLNNEVNGNSGGINAGLWNFPVLEEEHGLRTFFGIRAKVLYDKIPFALEMAREMLFGSSLESDRRLREILARQKSRLSMNLSSAGHSTAAIRGMSYFSAVSAFNDAVSGIRYYKFVEDLEQNFDQKKEELRGALRRLCGQLFCRERFLISVTMDEAGLEQARTCIEEFIESLPSEAAGAKEKCRGNEAAETRDKEPAAEAQALSSGTEGSGRGKAETAGGADGTKAVNEAFTTAGQVQYVARTGNFRAAGYPYTGALRILKVIMSYDYLWINIRVKGGAYGCMSSFGRTGDSYFVSYRDPHLEQTNRVYQGIPEYLEQFDVSDRDMTKYVIGTISDLDTPLTPQTQGSRSLNAWVSGVTEEMLQQERDEILAADRDAIRALAPLVRSVLEQEYICVIGNEAKIQKQKGLFRKIAPLAN